MTGLRGTPGSMASIHPDTFLCAANMKMKSFQHKMLKLKTKSDKSHYYHASSLYGKYLEFWSTKQANFLFNALERQTAGPGFSTVKTQISVGTGEKKRLGTLPSLRKTERTPLTDSAPLPFSLHF